MDRKIKTPTRDVADPAAAPLAGGGLVAGLAAMLGASCCVLPVLLVQAGVSAALVGRLGILAPYRTPMLLLAGALIAFATLAAFWDGRRPRPRVAWMLASGGALVVGAYLLPHFEPQLLKAILGQ